MAGLRTSTFARGARLAALPTMYAGRTAFGVAKKVGGAPAEAVANVIVSYRLRAAFQIGSLFSLVFGVQDVARVESGLMVLPNSHNCAARGNLRRFVEPDSLDELAACGLKENGQHEPAEAALTVLRAKL